MKERLTLTIGVFVASLILLSGCAGDLTGEPTVTFTRDACIYSGASTIDVDTELTIEVINESERSFGFSVWKVPDGTTVEDIQAQGMLTVGGDKSDNMRGSLRPGSVASRELVVLFDESGTWAMDCFTLLPGTIQTDEGYAAAVVEVR